MRTTYSSVYNTSAKGTPAPVAGSQAATYSQTQATQTTTYNSRGATAPPISTASAASQAGKVVVKVSGTTTSRITTPAVTAASNRVTTTSGKTTTSKQVGTPTVVATNNVKTTNTSTSTTRITTPAVTAGNVTTTGSSGSAKRVGTPAVTTYAATNGTSRTLSTPAVTRDAAALQAARGTLTKNLTAPKAEENSFMDGVHIALDVAGFVPVVGYLADLANGVIYATEGDWVNAGISTAAIFFDAATSARLVTNAAQNVIGATMTRVVREGAEETVERVGRETAENVAERIGREVVEGGRYSLPQGISQEQFSNASKLLRDRVGDISNDIVVQGSRAKGTAKPTSDIDIALRVSGDKFDSLINQYFKTPNPGSAKERTMLHAIETGKIQAGEAKLSGLRKELQEIFGMEVDISIIKQGGAFDNPPFIPFE